MNRFAILNAVVSLLIIALLLHFVGLEDVLSELGKIDIFFLFLSIMSLLVMDLIMSYRIGIILGALSQKISFMKIFRSHFVGMLLADFSPSRTGYFATAASLTGKGVPAEKALLSIFGPQIFDFIFKLFAGSVAVFYLLYVFIGFDDSLIFIGGVLLIIFIVLVMLLVLFSRRFMLMFSFLERIPLLGKVYSVALRMQDHSSAIVSKSGEIVLLIIISWNFRALSWYFAAKSVGITLDSGFPEFLAYYFLQPLVTMLEFVPSPTLAGLGLSETGSALVFSLLGVAAPKAVLFALVARFKSTLLHLPAVPEALGIVSDNLKMEKSDISDKKNIM